MPGRKISFVHQLDSMDCGLACLCMVASYYGKNYLLQDVRRYSNSVKVGMSFLDLCKAAEGIGLRATASVPIYDYFVKHSPLPCIVQWNSQHFILVYKIKKEKGNLFFYVADPAHGFVRYCKEEFKRGWCCTESTSVERGFAMSFATTPSFFANKPSKEKGMNLKYLVAYVKLYYKKILVLLFGLLLGCGIQMLFPLLTKEMVDKGVGDGNLHYLYIVLLCQLALALGALSVDVMRRFLLLHITTRINISIVSDFLVKMMRLPMRFFETKQIGDLIQRIEDHERIEIFLTDTMLNALFSTISIIVFSSILIYYNYALFLFLFIGSSLYVSWVIFFYKWRDNIDYKNFSIMSAYQSNIIELIEGMQEIKLTGCEERKRWEWEHLQNRIFKIKRVSLKIEQMQQIGSTFILEITSLLITFQSAKAVICGISTLGTMLSIQYIVGQIQEPVNQIVNVIQQTQNAMLSLRRLSEVHRLKEEQGGNGKNSFFKDKPTVLQNAVFGYSNLMSKKTIDNVSLTIPHGKVTALVGLSGSGKTTLVKLMLGFYKLESGRILLGDDSLDEYPMRKWRSFCGVVMQDGFIFSDTITNNIALNGDISIDKEKVKRAAEIANVTEFVNKLPLGFDTVIGENGMKLSQGQKQRILIARVIYRNPNYIFLDEATNSLDAKNEKKIISNLRGSFAKRTVVIVAHRLSTVKFADNIIVLNDGKVLEQGTHEYLISKKGMYYELVKEQLEMEGG